MIKWVKFAFQRLLKKIMDELYYKSVDLLKRLIATPSLSREENEASEIVCEYFRNNGFEPQRHGNNVWAMSPNFDINKPTLLLNSLSKGGTCITTMVLSTPSGKFLNSFSK